MNWLALISDRAAIKRPSSIRGPVNNSPRASNLHKMFSLILHKKLKINQFGILLPTFVDIFVVCCRFQLAFN